MNTCWANLLRLLLAIKHLNMYEGNRNVKLLHHHVENKNTNKVVN
jgi:hypothetical protein